MTDCVSVWAKGHANSCYVLTTRRSVHRVQLNTTVVHLLLPRWKWWLQQNMENVFTVLRNNTLKATFQGCIMTIKAVTLSRLPFFNAYCTSFVAALATTFRGTGVLRSRWVVTFAELRQRFMNLQASLLLITSNKPSDATRTNSSFERRANLEANRSEKKDIGY